MVECISLIIAGFLLSVALMPVFEGQAVAGSGSQQDEKWYVMNEVGFHLSGEKMPPEKLSADQAALYFSASEARLSKTWRAPEYEARVSASIESLKRSNKWFNPARNPAPFAEVARFSGSRVVVRVLYPLGGYMWHHYFETLAVYELERSRFIDGIFNLVEMEKRFSFTFKGIGHGTLAGFASNPDNEQDMVTKVLGKPDDEYLSQTPSYRLIYYRRYNISVEIHDGVVYAVEQGKPGWVVDK